jgi:DNA-binding response OmpR family regulator
VGAAAKANAFVEQYTIIIDDDPLIHKVIEKTISFKSKGFLSPAALISKMDKLEPMAVFLDIDLGGGVSGLDLIPMLKSKWPYCPLIVITSDLASESVGKALSAGAHDFLQKPFNPVELRARLKVRLQDAAQKVERSTVSVGDLTIDVLHMSLKGSKGKCSVGAIGLNILLAFVNAKGIVINREELKRNCWDGIAVSDNAVDRKLHEVRKSLQDVCVQVRVRSIYGVGFILELVGDKVSEFSED